jgi:hypothetical protein
MVKVFLILIFVAWGLARSIFKKTRKYIKIVKATRLLGADSGGMQFRSSLSICGVPAIFQSRR